MCAFVRCFTKSDYLLLWSLDPRGGSRQVVFGYGVRRLPHSPSPARRELQQNTHAHKKEKNEKFHGFEKPNKIKNVTNIFHRMRYLVYDDNNKSHQPHHLLHRQKIK